MIDAVRSPRGLGKPGRGALADTHPQRLAAQVLNALRDRTGLATTDVDDVILGSVGSAGNHAMDIARLSVLDAGWDVGTPGVTLHRHCGSGQQAVNFAAMGIMSGQQDVVVAGGVDSMSQFVPLHNDGFHCGNEHLYDQYAMVHQGLSADLIATLDGYSRAACDELALESQQRTAAAVADDRFGRSLVPIVDDEGNVLLEHDEHPRPATTLDDLAQLAPSFAGLGAKLARGRELSYDQIAALAYPEVDRLHHVHHAGNSSGVVDGAAAVLLSSRGYASANGLTPRARIVQTAVVGSEPVIMLTAPSEAAARCVERRRNDLRRHRPLRGQRSVRSRRAAVPARHRCPSDKVNVNGGAIALGHPIGATGAILIGTIIDELERRDAHVGLVCMCTGGGMGTATLVERV